MFSQRDVAYMRDAIESFMTQTATVRRSSTVEDGAGGSISTLEEVGTYQCHIGVSKYAGVGSVGDSFEDEQTYAVRFPVGTDIQLGDIIGIEDRDYIVFDMIYRDPAVCKYVEVRRPTRC